MKKKYIKPMIAEENLVFAQIIASSPSDSETPQISGGTSSGGEGLATERADWGSIW